MSRVRVPLLAPSPRHRHDTSGIDPGRRRGAAPGRRRQAPARPGRHIIARTHHSPPPSAGHPDRLGRQRRSRTLRRVRPAGAAGRRLRRPRPTRRRAGRARLGSATGQRDWAARLGAEALLTVPGDTPFIPPDLAAALAPPPACATTAGQVHHLVALWPTTSRDALRRFLTEPGPRGAQDFTAGLAMRRVAFSAAAWDP